MKLYKIDFTNTIGDYMVTVPTDSQFLIGIGNGDLSSTAQLFYGETEITPEDEKIGEYTCFRFVTDGTPSRKNYKAVIDGKDIDLLVICQKMSVAYRDFEGDVPSGEALVDAILDDDEATDELKAKMQVDAPLQITAPNASTQTIVITKDNYADIANKVWKVGSDTTGDNIKSIVLEINRTDFPAGNNYWRFLVSYKFPTDYHYMRYLSAMQGSFKIKDGDAIYKINNVHQYQTPNGSVIFPQTDMGGQTLTYEFLWDETIPNSSDAKFMAGRLINATVDMTSYI